MYWKQRYTANRFIFGDECTKFFHTMATTSFRKNTITQILNDQGAWIQDHEGKAGLLWNSFKKRLGVSPGISMHFELSNLITPRSNLLSLVEPWSHTEIDNIVKNMANDKAPGPYGFNGLFSKMDLVHHQGRLLQTLWWFLWRNCGYLWDQQILYYSTTKNNKPWDSQWLQAHLPDEHQPQINF